MANYRPAVGALAERKATKVEHCPCGTGAHTKKHTHASIGAIQVRRDPRHFAARARLESRAHADVSAFGKLHGLHASGHLCMLGAAVIRVSARYHS